VGDADAVPAGARAPFGRPAASSGAGRSCEPAPFSSRSATSPSPGSSSSSSSSAGGRASAAARSACSWRASGPPRSWARSRHRSCAARSRCGRSSGSSCGCR
jgi:hypothetical protein